MSIFNFLIVTVQYSSLNQTLGNGEGNLSKFSNFYENGLQILWAFLKSLLKLSMILWTYS